MPNFKKYNYDQDTMIVVNFEEQLQPNTFEYTLHKLIDNHIDLSAFYEKYSNDSGGRSAYDPAVLLKIILFAYSKGITSSREIQWQCEHNIIYKALSCDSVPHFTSIANFVSSYPDAIESVFEQVLLVCDEEGLLGKELFAIDGCKMSSNAAKEHSGTLDELSRKREKLRNKIQCCMQEHKKLDGRKPSDILHAGTIVTADTGFSNDANNAYLKENNINDYIPDNQFRSRDKQFESQKEHYGKRHQDAVIGIKKVIPSSEFNFNLKNKTCHCPMGKEMWLHHEVNCKNGKRKLFFEGKLTDCRHCPIKDKCMRNPNSADTPTGNGRQVSITFTNGRTPTDWMKRRVDSKKGKAIYSHRMSTV